MIYEYAGALCTHLDEIPIELDTTQYEQSFTQKTNDDDDSLLNIAKLFYNFEYR